MSKIMSSRSGKLVAISEGELTVTGRLVDASNATLYAHVVYEDEEIICIYKPIAGERPLWDFDQGCLAHREFAAYCVSNYLSLDLVPFTVLRDGPYGQGMVQEWIDIDESIDLSLYFSQDRDELRKMALFDVIVNNTDRKIGHLLPNLTDDEIALLQRCKQGLNGELGEILSPLLTGEEIQAFGNRVDRILESQMFPEPSPDWPAVPWPAF